MTSSSSASISEEFELIDHKDADVEPADLLSKLQAWLQPTDYTADSSEFHRHLSSQAPGTGLWICDTARYQQWHQSDHHGSLWVKGVPGAGKSVIAASMVQHLQTTEDVPVLFFFFRYIIASNRRPRNLIQDYLTQLLPYSPRLRGTLWPLLDSELDHLSDDRLWEFLLLGLASVEKAYCIVDAMDEMEVDTSFLQRLNDLATFRPKSVKLFMTSRPKQYLQSALRDASIVHISLEDDLVGKDIAVFVTHRLRDVLSGDQNDQLRENLESTIRERSRGLFLYARLLVDQIIPKLHAAGQLDIKKLATSLPVGLEEMYNAMLYQNTQSLGFGTDVQVFLLQFVTHSSRVLRLNELANILAFEFPSKKLTSTPKNVVRFACAPLLEILEDETVQVIHHSFTEFLLDQERMQSSGKGSVPQFPVLDPHSVHKNMAMVSLRYLQSGVLRHPDSDEFERQSFCSCDWNTFCRCQRDKQKDPYNWQASKLAHPFLDYAVHNWTFHCQKYDEDDEIFLQAVSTFLNPDNLDFKRWLRIEWTRRLFPDAARMPAPLHVAAFSGMTKYAAMLLRDDSPVDPKDPDERTPLHWACRRGHLAIASLLLQNGAQANAEDFTGTKPIHEAASRNHSEIVKLLLQAGVDPMTPKTKENHGGRLKGGERSTRNETAPEYACKRGHLDTIVAMLPYLELKGLEEVLGRACRCGEFEIVKAVLNCANVSPNAKFDGATALYIAVTARSISIVELLLSKGADPAEQCDYAPNYRRNGGGRYGPGLLMAPIHVLMRVWIDDTRTCQKILTMLVEAGADIDAKNGVGDTPLLTLFEGRSRSADPSFMQLKALLDAGADVLATDKDGECALLRCLANYKNLELVQLLLGYGGTLDMQGAHGNTPLHRALEDHHGQVNESINAITTLLLEKGAKPDIQNQQGITPLQQVMSTPTCTIDTFKLLLEKSGSADVKRCMWFIGNRKTIVEEKKFVEALLEHGASLEDRNSQGQTPIISITQSSTASEALRLCGADIHAVDNDGRGLLHNYVYRAGGYPVLATFKQYLGYGLDPTMVDGKGNTLLHAAASGFGGVQLAIDFVEFLLMLGISMNAKNENGDTPLMVNIKFGRVNSSSNEKRLPLLDLFRKHGQKEVLDLDVQNNEGIAAIHLAALRSEFDFHRLLSAGANAMLVTKKRRNVLHLACRGRQTNTVALIADKCKELINAQDDDGRSPLHDACASGRPETVYCLLRAGAGASIHLKDNNQRTPLHACALFPLEHKIWSLLEHRDQYKPDPVLTSICNDQFRPRPGRTYNDIPWYNCSWQTSPSSTEHDTTRIGGIIDMLLEAGADTMTSDFMNRFPLDLAIENDCKEMISKLAFTSEKILESRKAKEKEIQKLTTLLAIKSVFPGSRLDQLDAKTKKEVFDAPEAWMKMFDYSSFCSYIKTHKEELAEDPEQISKLAQEAASEGLTEVLSALGLFASINDDHTFTLARITATVAKGTSIWNIYHPNYAPILQTACSRATYNLQALQILVENGKVDVDARAIIKPPQKSLSNSIYGLPGPTSLHVLAEAKSYWQLSGIEYLVSKGADINGLNDEGETPLHVASQGNLLTGMGVSQRYWTPAAVKLLLILGADPNILSQDGSSCLNKAASSPEIMKLLLAHGASINIGNPNPLFTAIEFGNLDVLKVLLEAGGDPNSVDEMAGLSIDYKVKGDKKRFALFCACFASRLDHQSSGLAGSLVELLIRRGADPYAILSKTETLIHYIFEHSSEYIIHIFLNPSVRGLMDWETKDQLGRTVLLAAANWIGALSGYRHLQRENKQRAPVIQLLDLGVNPFAVDNEGKNALHHLCANEDIEEDTILQFLAHDSAPTLLSQKDKQGYLPLHFALIVLRPTIVERILELTSREQLLIADPEGKTAFHHIASQCLETEERNRSPYSNDPHPNSWHVGVVSLFNKYLSLGGSLNAPDNLGNTPLLTFLASPSHSPSYHSEFKETHTTYVETLFGAADWKVVNDKGEGALHVVANREGKEGVDKELFEILMKRGLDPLMEDGEGRTALDVAAARGKEGILGLFERGGK